MQAVEQHTGPVQEEVVLGARSRHLVELLPAGIAVLAGRRLAAGQPEELAIDAAARSGVLNSLAIF